MSRRRNRRHHAVIVAYYVEADKHGNPKICVEPESIENLCNTYNKLVLKNRQSRDFESIVNEIAERVKASIANGIFIGLVKVKL